MERRLPKPKRKHTGRQQLPENCRASSTVMSRHRISAVNGADLVKMGEYVMEQFDIESVRLLRVSPRSSAIRQPFYENGHSSAASSH